MKYLIAIMIVLFSGTSFFSNSSTSDYDNLWKRLKKEEENGLPKSAFKIADEIYVLALKEKQEDQLIKAIIYKVKLSSQFEDKDMATYLEAFESELESLTLPKSQAVFSSMLGELYARYARQNMHRFNNRTEVRDQDAISAIEMMSLEQIQEKSLAYFEQSLSFKGDAPLLDFAELTTSIKERKQPIDIDLKIESKTLQQFLLFRAIDHFSNDGSFVSLNASNPAFNSTEVFSDRQTFVNLNLKRNDNADYKTKTLELYQRALSDDTLEERRRVLVDLKRLEYVSGIIQDDSNQEKMINALGNVIDNSSDEAIGLAYAKLIEIKYQHGSRYLNKNIPEFENAYLEAFEILEKAKSENFKTYEPVFTILENRLNGISLTAHVEGVVLPQKDFLAQIEFRNIPKVFCKVIKLTPSQSEKLKNENRRGKKLSLINDFDVYKSWDQQLPEVKDYNQNITEIGVGGLDYGNYVLVVSNNNDFRKDQNEIVVINEFTASNLAYFHTSHGNSTEAYIVDRTSGEPVANAKIEVLQQDYNQNTRRNNWKTVSNLTSDKDGYFEYSSQQKQYVFVISKGADVLDLRHQHYNYRSRDNRKSQAAHIFTDRAIYRPGQTIYYKALLLENSPEQIPMIMPETEVTVTLRDVNWQEVDKQSLKTNAYGTINGFFTAPINALAGNMNIEVKFYSGRGQQHIRVEEYKRPKIYAEFDKLEEAYVLGDTVDLKGNVKSFSGSSMAEAKVVYRVMREKKRYWFMPSYRRSYYYAEPSQSKMIVSGELKTDEKGKFTVNVPTSISAVDGNNYYQYKVYADVVDITGETTQVTKTFSLSKSPYSFSTDLPEKCFEGDLDSIKLTVSNIEGVPLDATVNIKVDELNIPDLPYKQRYWDEPSLNILTEKEFKSRFPDYGYVGEEKEVVANASVIEEVVQANIEAVDVFENLNQGFYKVTFEIKDEAGNEKQEVRYVSVTGNESPALPTQHLWVSQLENKYEVGEKLVLKIGAAYKDHNIFYRFSQRQDDIEKAWLKPKQNKIVKTIKESDRGGLTLEVIMVKNNRVYNESFQIDVPWSNKALDFVFESFRDKLEPGSDEVWKIKINDKKGKLQDAEVMATIYDASLDKFVKHSWERMFYPEYYGYKIYQATGFDQASNYRFGDVGFQNYHIHGLRFSPTLDWFGFYFNQNSWRGNGDVMMESMAASGAPAPRGKSMRQSAGNYSVSEDALDEDGATGFRNEKELEKDSPDAFAVRENLNETVFFYPTLNAEEGLTTLSFKMNEALTKWNLMLFAHNKEFKYAFDVKEIITQKQLMIEPHLPRFVRQGDVMTVNAKVTNLSAETIDAVCALELSDFISDTSVNDDWLKSSANQVVSLAKGESKNVTWQIEVPNDFAGALKMIMKAEGGAYSDGEQNIIPVLSNRMLVTESMPFHIDSESAELFDFKAMQKVGSSTSLTNHNYSVEVTTNPSWLVLKTLPFLLDKDVNSTTQLFDGWYGTMIGNKIVSENVNIQNVIKAWAEIGAHESNLSKNTELKISGLNETPWVKDALREESVMKDLSIFLDHNNVNQALEDRWKSIKKRQTINGGFSWMPGGKDNWYITQYILEGIAHLKQMGVDVSAAEQDGWISRAVKYSDDRLKEYYEDTKSRDNEYIEARVIQYLYVRSFFKDVKLDSQLDGVINYYLKKAGKHWKKLNSYQQAMLSLSVPHWNKKQLSDKIYASITERMVINKELGNYWNDQAGYYWYNSNIEKQALMIALFKEKSADQKTIDALKLFLLKNKQVNSWKTSRQTSAAVYAFMLDGEHWLTDEGAVEVYVAGGAERIDFQNAEMATGYMKKNWAAENINKSLSSVKVVNPNKHVSWGASYWQYFEDLDKIEVFDDTPLTIKKSVTKVDMDDNGEILSVVNEDTQLQPGDKLRMRIELRVDRPMEFIEMKDMRSSGLEPFNVLSQYKWQDGLSYYESTKDLATYFYFDYLPKGNFVFEYDVYASHLGTFSNGITEIQSAYAPEFSSHSEGVSLTIGE